MKHARIIVYSVVGYLAAWVATMRFAPGIVARHIKIDLEATDAHFVDTKTVTFQTMGCPAPFLFVIDWTVYFHGAFPSQSGHEGLFLCLPWRVSLLSENQFATPHK
jgi:hypothetical protein